MSWLRVLLCSTTNKHANLFVCVFVSRNTRKGKAAIISHRLDSGREGRGGREKERASPLPTLLSHLHSSIKEEEEEKLLVQGSLVG